MINIVNKLFKSISSSSLNKYKNFVEQVNNYEEIISNLSDEEIKEKTNFFKKEIANWS